MREDENKYFSTLEIYVKQSLGKSTELDILGSSPIGYRELPKEHGIAERKPVVFERNYFEKDEKSKFKLEV